MIESAVAAPAPEGSSDNAARRAERTPLRSPGRLPAPVALTIERRIALLDELETLQERRTDLNRRSPAVGGRELGEHPDQPSAVVAGDARHRLAAALASVDQHERRLDELRMRLDGALR